MRYEILPMNGELPELTGEPFDPDQDDFCAETPFAPIDSYVWSDLYGYMPEARAYVRWNAEGLHVLLCAREDEISVKTTEFCGPVYKDSCLEFFLQPFQDDPRYLNIETNAGGCALIGFGPDRGHREHLPKEPEGMQLRASRHRGDWWAVAYRVPATALKELFGRVPKPGDVMRGNFYKCDESIHPHFGSWSPVISPQPDFHRPEWFAELKLVEKENA